MDKLKGIGAFLSGLYVLSALAASILFVIDSRIDCAKQHGFFAGITGCDVIEGNFGPAQVPGFATHVFKGFVWPYFVFFDGDAANSEAEEDISIEKLNETFAKKLVAYNNERIGESAGIGMKIRSAAYSNKSITLNYDLEQNFYNFTKATQKSFAEHIRNQVCSDSDVQGQMYRGFLATGNKIIVNYFMENKNYKFSIVINSCS